MSVENFLYSSSLGSAFLAVSNSLTDDTAVAIGVGLSAAAVFAGKAAAAKVDNPNGLLGGSNLNATGVLVGASLAAFTSSLIPLMDDYSQPHSAAMAPEATEIVTTQNETPTSEPLGMIVSADGVAKPLFKL